LTDVGVEVARATREEATEAAETARLASEAALAGAAEVEARRAAVTAARDAADTARQAAADAVVHQQQLVATLQQQKATYAAQVQALSDESNRIAAALRTAPPSSAPPASTTATKPSTAPKAPPPTTSKPVPPATRSVAGAPTTTATTRPPPPTQPATTAHAPATTFPQNYAVGNPPATGVVLTYPIPGAPVVSTFGSRLDPVLGVVRVHEGIDIWAGEGTPIHAAGAGTVTWAGPRNGYGNAVFIDHGHGVVTIYAHQSQVAVAVGQRVSAGAVIGFVGHTGLAAGPHLHFEVRINGTAYDPLKFVSPR
jgi:murein DD-endopeptidase MepM/ murein hydrolase activator NlpD